MEQNQVKISQMADNIMSEFLIRSKTILKNSGIKPTDENIHFVFDRLYVLEGTMTGLVNKAKEVDQEQESEEEGTGPINIKD